MTITQRLCTSQSKSPPPPTWERREHWTKISKKGANVPNPGVTFSFQWPRFTPPTSERICWGSNFHLVQNVSNQFGFQFFYCAISVVINLNKGKNNQDGLNNSRSMKSLGHKYVWMFYKFSLVYTKTDKATLNDLTSSFKFSRLFNLFFQGDLPPVIKKLKHHLMDVFGQFVCMLHKMLCIQYF